MPLYDYLCQTCAWREEKRIPLADFNMAQFCSKCGAPTQRQISAVYGKMAGQIVKGGGPDRFTADMMGVPLKELPPHLKAEPPK